jgi:hypothetical protein
MTEMSVYRRCWLAAAWCAFGTGILMAAAVLTLPNAVALAITFGFLGGTYGFLWSPQLTSLRHPVVVGASLVPLTVFATIGLVQLLSGWALLLAVVLITTSPPVTAMVARGRRAARAEVDTDFEEAVWRAFTRPEWLLELPEALHHATERELVDGWKVTATGLSRVTNAAMVDRIAEVRGAFLDEFEARDPAGFRAWLGVKAETPDGPPRQDR